MFNTGKQAVAEVSMYKSSFYRELALDFKCRLAVLPMQPSPYGVCSVALGSSLSLPDQLVVAAELLNMLYLSSARHLCELPSLLPRGISVPKGV